MTEISIEDFCIALYCTYTQFDALSPDAAGTIAFTARMVETGREVNCRVQCTGVHGFEFRSEVPDPKWGPQDQLELSVVELEGAPGSWRIWFNPFYLHEIEFRCGQLSVNGAEVVGRGKHLQDGLPARPADVPPSSPGAA